MSLTKCAGLELRGYFYAMSLRDDPTLYRFENCRILRHGRLLDRYEALWVRGGRVQDPRKIFWDEKRKADVTIDCRGLVASPGFIDLQINGAVGYDFTSSIDDTEKAVHSVAKTILRHGVTAFCPTIVSSLPTVYRKVLPQLVAYKSKPSEAQMLGIHLEGPFISSTKCGAHCQEAVWDNKDTPITYETIRSCYGSLDGVRIVTLAPELKGMCEVIRELSTEPHKIAVSLGHSEANLQIAEEAVHCGARFITHLFNAMLPFHHRDPGIVGLLASHRLPEGCTVYYGLISDGVHTDPAALRIAHRACPEGVVLVTDAIAAMGLGNGVHRLGMQDIEIKDACHAFIRGQQTLAGSVATMDRCVRHYLKASGCTVEQALESATLHPARLLGIESDIGTLNFGSRADFVLLNDDLFVQETYIGGQRVFPYPESQS